MDVFFAPRRFLLSLGLDKVLLLASFLFPFSVLLPSERVCSHSCIHLRPSRFRMRRRDVLVTYRSTFLRCVSTAI